MASLQRVYCIRENLHKIDISCEQITFNPMDDTVTISACDLKNIRRNNKSTNTPKNSRKMKQPSVHNGGIIVDNDRYDYCSTSNAVADIICISTIALLVLIWIAVFIFVEIKESDFHNSIYLNNTHFMDEASIINWIKK